MGSKIGNNNPTQSFESSARAFQDVLESPAKKESYLVGKKTKDKCEIDGVAPNVTHLSQKSRKHGPAAAAYRLGGRRKAQYKEASRLLDDLVKEARDERSGLDLHQISAAQSIHIELLLSKSKGYIKTDEKFRNNLEIVVEALKTKTLKSAEAVQMDYGDADGNIPHFLDDLEAIKSKNDSTLAAREDIRKQGEGNVRLLDQIALVNEWATTIKLKSKTVTQLTLKSPSFTAPAASTAGEVVGNNLLDKIGVWPGVDLQLKMNCLFERAKPEYGPDAFKEACKGVLLELSKQRFILSSLSDEFLDTIKDEVDKEKLRALADSVKKLLLAFGNSDSPFTRLEDLARAGYNYPKETAQELVKKRAAFLDKGPTGLLPPLPVNVQPGAGNGQPAANVPRTPGNAPGNSQGLRPLPAIPGAVPPVPGSVPSPSNLAQPAANVVPSALPSLPSIPNGPPPPLPGVARPYDTEGSSAKPGVRAAVDRLFDRPGGPLPPNDEPPLAPHLVQPVSVPSNPASVPPDDEPPLAPHLVQPVSVPPNPASVPPDDEPPLAPHLVQPVSVPPNPASVPPDDEPPLAPHLVQPVSVPPNPASVPPDDEPPLAPHLVQPVSVPPNPVSVPPDDEPPLAPHLVQAVSVPLVPAGLPGDDLSLSLAKSAASSKIVPNGVAEFSGSSPLMPSNPALPAANVVGVQLPPEEPPPPLPSNLPPTVLNGVLVPLKDVAPGGVGKAEPVDSRAKGAIDELFARSNVPPAPGIQPFPTTAAKLLAGLTSSDKTYLTASKVDDGTDHRVVTKKGKVLFLKASSTQEEVGLRSLVNNRLLGRRDAQTKKALKALLGDAERRGLMAEDDPGHGAPLIKHALELGRNGVKFDDFVLRNVRTILTEDIKRQKAAADRIAKLFDRSKEPQPKDPEAAIDQFLAANGSDFKENGKEHFLNKLLAVTGRTNTSVPPLDELALPPDRRNHQLAKSIDLGLNFTYEAGVEMHAKETALNRSFHDATNSFVVEQMRGANIFPASNRHLGSGLLSR